MTVVLLCGRYQMTSPPNEFQRRTYLLQQQTAVQDRIPKATTITKVAMITYKTLHSAKKIKIVRAGKREAGRQE